MTTRHPQADILEAIAAGKQCQYVHRSSLLGWVDGGAPEILPLLVGDTDYYVRVKPDREPDVVMYTPISMQTAYDDNVYFEAHQTSRDSLKLTFDAETGKLISAEVIE